MKSKILLIALLLPMVSVAQTIPNNSVNIPNDDFQVTNGKVYYLSNTKLGKKKSLHYFSVEKPNEIKELDLGSEFNNKRVFAVEGEYLHTANSYGAYKYKMSDMSLVWEADMDSKWSVQLPPQLVGNYVIYAFDDFIYLLDKESGKAVHIIKGRNLEYDVSIVDNRLIYSKFNGTLFCYDLRSKKLLWSKDVGETSGFGVAKDGKNYILPSWSARLYCVQGNTGKEVWKIKLDEIKNGCGSGFEEAPVIYGDNFYAPHRDKGFFIFNKKTGELVKNIDLSGEFIVGGAFLFKDIIWFSGDNRLFGFNPLKMEMEYNIKLPDKYACDPVLDGKWFILNEDRKDKTCDILFIDLEKVMAKK